MMRAVDVIRKAKIAHPEEFQVVKRVSVAADMNIKPIAVVASRRTRAFASRRHRAPDHAGGAP